MALVRAGGVVHAARPRLGGALAAYAILGSVLAAGCARTLVDRAIAARGGRLESLLRESEARVYEGFPGEWSWEIAYRYPDLFRWTLHTFGEEQSYVYDGSSAVMYLGSAALPTDPAFLASFRSQARWFAVTMLDVLADASRVSLRELPADRLLPGSKSGVEARFGDDGATYLLFFDDRDLLVSAEGWVSLPPIGAGSLRVELRDYRVVDGFALPWTGRYWLEGQQLVDERVLRYAPDDPALTAAVFAAGPP